MQVHDRTNVLFIRIERNIKRHHSYPFPLNREHHTVHPVSHR